jgi:L-cysteate sulfo-lyase
MNNFLTSSPLQLLPRLSEAFGGPQIYIKRDDLLDPIPGGNKVRKLEAYLEEARRLGATRLVTCGAIQSNHVRITACMARRAGLLCTAILRRTAWSDNAVYANNGNRLLLKLLDTQIIEVARDTDLKKELETTAESLRLQGEVPYVIPFGGSGIHGTLAMTILAQEIIQQATALNFKPSKIIVANGSHGTHAGLAAGLLAAGWPDISLGFSVLADAQPASTATRELASNILQHLKYNKQDYHLRCEVRDEQRGNGYGIPTNDGNAAIAALARHEAIFLDPVYTGKAFAGLIQMIRSGELRKEDSVVFVHTGGLAGLFAYENQL